MIIGNNLDNRIKKEIISLQADDDFQHIFESDEVLDKLYAEYKKLNELLKQKPEDKLTRRLDILFYVIDNRTCQLIVDYLCTKKIITEKEKTDVLDKILEKPKEE